MQTFQVLIQQIAGGTITEVKLQDVQFQGDQAQDIQKILEGLKTNKSVIKVDLSGMTLTLDNILKLSEVVSVNRTIKSFNLANTGLTDMQLQILLLELGQNPKIIQVDVSGNTISVLLVAQLQAYLIKNATPPVLPPKPKEAQETVAEAQAQSLTQDPSEGLLPKVFCDDLLFNFFSPRKVMQLRQVSRGWRDRINQGWQATYGMSFKEVNLFTANMHTTLRTFAWEGFVSLADAKKIHEILIHQKPEGIRTAIKELYPSIDNSILDFIFTSKLEGIIIALLAKKALLTVVPKATAVTYVVQANDTFAAIAHRTFGTADFAGLIAHHNGWLVDDIIPVGAVLNIPTMFLSHAEFSSLYRHARTVSRYNYAVDGSLEAKFNIMLDERQVTLTCCVPSAKFMIIIEAEQSLQSLLIKSADEVRAAEDTDLVIHYNQHGARI